MSRRLVVLAGLMTVSILGAGCTREVSYKQDVFPILSENCLSCHKVGGTGLAKSGLNMETYEGLMKGTKLGPIVNPGSSVSSTLVLLIERQAHPSINMPKDKPPIAADQIKTIRQWIDQGAKNN
jgi:hypothetical protein